MFSRYFRSKFKGRKNATKPTFIFMQGQVCLSTQRLMAAQLALDSSESEFDKSFSDVESSDYDDSQNHGVEGAVISYICEPEVMKYLAFITIGTTSRKDSAMTSGKAVNCRARTWYILYGV